MNQNVQFRCCVATASLIAVLAGICLIQATANAASGLKHKPKQPAGGANQVQGLNGKLGQMLFTGYWRFEAIAVHTDLTSYTLKLPMAQQNFGVYRDVATFNRVEDPTPNTFLPRAGYVLATVDCLLKNGQHSVQECDCSLPEDAVADDQEQSFSAMGYDMLTDGPAETKQMLPGSSEKMTIIFVVPAGTKLKDLVFAPMNAGPGGGQTKKDVRISLAAPVVSKP